MLPVIGIGTSRVFEFENDPAALAERKQVVQALVAGGGSLIDTAAGYGTAEANVGTVSAETNLRSKLFLATKFSSRDSRAEADAELKQSFARLKTNYVDLQQAWNVYSGDFSCAQMKEWKAAGHCKHYGITSSFDGAYDALEAVLRKRKAGILPDQLFAGRPRRRKGAAAAGPGQRHRRADQPALRPQLDVPEGEGQAELPDFAKEIDCTSFAQLFLKYNLSPSGGDGGDPRAPTSRNICWTI